MLRVGIDLVCVDGVTSAIRDHGERYLARVYTPREQADCQDAPERLAARFAAKEATMKVLRPEPGDAIPWESIEITEQPGGGVALRLEGPAAAQAQAADLSGFTVSFSRQNGLACAIVVAMARQRGR